MSDLLEPQIVELRQQIATIQQRNRKVTADKAWETSWARRGLIFVLTYMVVAAYLSWVVHIDPWINALVPVIGFGLSTLTLGVVKNVWLSRRYAEQSQPL
jgi:hypothetical protein